MKTLIHSLLLSLILNPSFVHAEDTPTQTLQGINAGLGAIGQFAGAVGVSQQQTQALFTQAQALMTANQTGQTAQTAFNQTIAQLAQTMGEVETCMQGKVKDTSKFKKAKPGMLLAEPTCSTYGAMIDTGKKTALDIQTAQGKLACVQDMQNKFNTIADSAKAPFQQLTQAATENWNIRDQIITIHQGIADKIKNDLDGDNGYRKKLSDLKKLSLDLRSVINGKAGETKDGGIGTGLVAKAEALKRDRVKTANQWNLLLLNDTNQCFFSDTSMGCDAAQTPLSPAECIARQVATPAGANKTKAARNEANTAALNQVMRLNATRAQNINNLANIDVKNPDQFLQFNKNRFDKMVEEMSGNLANKRFLGSDVDASSLAGFYRSKMNECYSQAVNRFKAGLTSEGSQYKEMLNGITDREAELTNDAKLWIETSQQQMNEFRTAFNKVYNNELPQFTSSCTASEDPYVSIDCLKILSASLKSGIEGTAQSVKLGNGTNYTANEGITTLNVQSMSTDSAGKPSMSQSQVQCRGFNECITFLERSQESHNQEVQSQTQARDKFVTENNKNIDTALGGVASTFTQSTSLITSKVKEINELLVAAGINAQVATKTVEGETLVANEKTKLYDNPKSMKAALAGKGTFVEIDKEKTEAEVKTAMNDRVTAINEKMKDAFKKKGQCEIKKAYYEGIADALGECSSDRFCRGGVATKAMSDMEDLFQRSQTNPDPEEKNKVTEAYNTCVSKAKSDAKDFFEAPSSDDFAADEAGRKAYRSARDEAKADARTDANEGVVSCNEKALNNLSNLARASRGIYSDNNTKVINALKKLNDACGPGERNADTKKIEFPDVQTECEEAKRSINKATIDDSEGPSPDKDSGTGTPGTGNPLRDAK